MSLLLLGLAYGIFEEGLMVRSFFDPHWMDLGSLGVYGRVAGVNWVWAYHLTVFHAVVSILASVRFVEILVPERRRESWVTSRKGWVTLWGFLLLTLGLGKVLNPYDAPDGWMLLCWLTMLALIGLARWLPYAGEAAHMPDLHIVPRPSGFSGWPLGAPSDTMC